MITSLWLHGDWASVVFPVVTWKLGISILPPSPANLSKFKNNRPCSQVTLNSPTLPGGDQSCLSPLKEIDITQLARMTGGRAPPLRYLFGGRKSAPT